MTMLFNDAAGLYFTSPDQRLRDFFACVVRGWRYREAVLTSTLTIG
jgi:hypothetical protein